MVMFAQPLGEGTYRLDSNRRVRIEDDDIVEVGLHLVQASDSLVAHLDGPAGRSTASLEHDELWCAKRRERNGVRVRGIKIE